MRSIAPVTGHLSPAEREHARAIRVADGDVLIVTRLDRLARSTRDLLNIIDAVAKASATFKSIHDAYHRAFF